MDFSPSSGYRRPVSDSNISLIHSIYSELDNWLDAACVFINKPRAVIDGWILQRRSDRRGRDDDSKDRLKDPIKKEKDSRSGNMNHNRRSPRGDDEDSNSSNECLYFETSPVGSFEDYFIDSDDDKEMLRYYNCRKEVEVTESADKNSDRGGYSYYDNDKKCHNEGSGKKNSIERHESDSCDRDNSRDKNREGCSKNLKNDDSYNISETIDTKECEDRSCQYRSDDESSSCDFDKLPYDDAPNRTIIIRVSDHHINESTITKDTLRCNLVPNDIRVMRDETGNSLGLAFVEFVTSSEAAKWLEMKEHEFMLEDQYRARAEMQYNIDLNNIQMMERKTGMSITEWHCRCLTRNYTTQFSCCFCGVSRQVGEIVEGYEEACFYPTETVLLRGLDASTTEESVWKSIIYFSSTPIRYIDIGRDPVTNTSRGVCYLKMNSIRDAFDLYNTLLQEKPVIDRRQPWVSYSRLDPKGNEVSSLSNGPRFLTAVPAAHRSNQNTNNSSQYTLNDVNRISEYTASLYASNPQENLSYLVYYQYYYRDQISKGNQFLLPSSSSEIPAPKENETHDDGKTAKTPLNEPPNGLGTETYPTPEIHSYQYDNTSGYFYDPYTTLYFDPNSQYYYNLKTQAFLYWDAVKHTYLKETTGKNLVVNTATEKPSDSTTAENAACDNNAANENAKNGSDLQKTKEKESDKDKVKVAKQIAKDMKKWAETLNHKKKVTKKKKLISTSASQPSLKAPGAADIGYAILEREDLLIPSERSGKGHIGESNDSAIKQIDTPLCGSNYFSLDAGNDRVSDNKDEQGDGPSQHTHDKQFTYWNKLACLLCKRQFKSKYILVKHQKWSDLHKRNVEKWNKTRELATAQEYRERYEERRLKYSNPDQHQPKKLKKSCMKAREVTLIHQEPMKMGLGEDRLGDKQLQKKASQEGLGRSKKDKDRTSIMKSGKKSTILGLSTKSKVIVSGPGESHKDCVER